MITISTFAQCAGNWTGTNRLIVNASEPPDESPSDLMVTPLLNDTFVRLDQHWVYKRVRQEGSLLIGFDTATSQYSLHWIDSFHMGRKVMACSGDMGHDPDHIDVQGSYAAEGLERGWRINIDGREKQRIEINMFDVDPSGRETLAVTATYQPA